MPLIVGIDISERQIKAAFVHATFRSASIVGYAREDILPTEHGLEQACAALFHKAPGRPELVVAGLSGMRSGMHLLRLPKGVLQQARAILPSELESAVPFPLSDAIIDYHTIEQDRKIADLWAAASPTKDVAARIDHLDAIGVRPNILVPQPLALSSLAELETAPYIREQVVALIDIRDIETDLCILDKAAPRFCQTLSAGLQQVQQGQRKQLSDQLVRALTSYRASTDQAIEAVVLTGSAVNMPGALKWLEEELAMPCRALDLPSGSDVSGTVAPADCGAALALALYATRKKHSINLRQGAMALATPIGDSRQIAMRAAAGLVAVIMCLYVALGASYLFSSKKREVAEAELSALTAQIWGVSVASAEEAQALISGGSNKADPMPEHDAYDVMQWLSEVIPTDIKHDTKRLLVEHVSKSAETRGELAGVVDTIAQRDVIVAALKEKDCIRDVEPGPTSPSQDGRQNYQLEFKVSCASPLTVAVKESGNE